MLTIIGNLPNFLKIEKAATFNRGPWQNLLDNSYLLDLPASIAAAATPLNR
jgi:hypothetical protein